MHYSLPIAALAALAVAKPIPGNNLVKRGRFSVAQRQRSTIGQLGQVANRKTYLKYGIAPPENIQRAAESAIAATSVKATGDGGQGTVTAEPAQQDSEYLEKVNVGGTAMMLDFDTGSSDLWVFSSLQSASETTGHAVYQATDANVLDGQTWSISYGDGSSAGGNVYTGTVEIGGVTATSQAIEAASEISTQFQQDTDNDGLVGLGFSNINQVQPTAQKTFFDNVADQLESPLFTVNLQTDATGSYDFGFLDQSKYTGDITYADVDSSQGFWEFQPDSYDAGSGSQTFSGTAILDTGSTLWYMPTAAVQAYYSQVPSAQNDQQQGGFTFDCTATLPSMSVTISGTEFTIDGSLINFAEIGDGSCFGGLQDGSDLPVMIFGDVFLRGVYAVFDSQGPRIGLAPQAGASTTTGGTGSNSTSSSNSTTPISSPTASSAPTAPTSPTAPTPTAPQSPSGTGSALGGFGSGSAHKSHGHHGSGHHGTGSGQADPSLGFGSGDGSSADDSSSLLEALGELLGGNQK